MNEKQQQLLFDKGITNVPSDALCSDNALEESLGMVYDNGEHRVIQKPNTFMTNAPTVIYIHRFNDQERYITIDGNNIKWGTRNVQGVYTPAQTQGVDVVLMVRSGAYQTTSIGKTLVISDSNGLHYFLWKENEYSDMGDIPEPIIDFDMYKARNCHTAHGAVPSGFGDGGILDDGQEDYNNWAIGLYSKNLKSVARKKGFCEPFFVRAAVKLYDGTYTLITQPFLMLPCIRHNSYGTYGNGNSGIHTEYSKLRYKQTRDYSNWTDIVKDITLFVTRGVSPYDLTIDLEPEYLPAGTKYADGVYKSIGQDQATMDYRELALPSDLIERYRFLPFKDRETAGVYHKSDEDIINELKGESVFYKLCDIGLTTESSFSFLDQFIEPHTIENIETQEQLENDDYFSRSKLTAKYTYAYNSRLNIANVNRSIFQGYKDFMPLDGSSHTYIFYVRIKTDSGEKFAEQTITTSRTQGFYFYYPDSRADYLWIYRDGTCIIASKLKEHGGLNGALYLEELPNASGDTPTTRSGESLPASRQSTPEQLPNYIIQSEVNNPFVFKAEGYFKISTGKLIGLSTITQALSEGQFGQYPLLAFADSGIWALSVGNTGYYTSVHPMSREVALEENPCITQTDGAVFFASKKGLMVVVGGQVKCVSEQLSGKDGTFNGTTNIGNFINFLNSAIIAYDYRDSLLWIFDKSHTACYVYSIKSGTFGKFDFGSGNTVTNVVNYYPDYLIQNANGVYSLLERPNINVDGTTSGSTFTPNTYNTKLISRPMKLENALALKSIMQIKHIHDIENLNGTGANDPALTFKMYGSNNLKNWVQLQSLRGVPWKYYRFEYDFTKLKATDRFSGTMLVTQERRTDKLR